MPICASCGQDNPDIAKFCLACGAPLAAQPTSEERKLITVLFTDIAPSTAKAENMDPEDVRARLAPYYVRLRTELERFGGTVEKFDRRRGGRAVRRAGRTRRRPGASRSSRRSPSAARLTS